MIAPELYAEYRAERAKPHRPSADCAFRAVQWARAQTPGPFSGRLYHESVRVGDAPMPWTVDGFTLTARIQHDEHAGPLDCVEAAPRRNPHTGELTAPEGTFPIETRRGPLWFRPESWRTYEAQRRHLLATHGRAEADRIARANVRADVERVRAYFRDDWYYVGVVLTVTRGGIELSSASLWGIESDSGAAYFNEVCAELEHDALPDARDKLEELADRETDNAADLLAALRAMVAVFNRVSEAPTYIVQEIDPLAAFVAIEQARAAIAKHT